MSAIVTARPVQRRLAEMARTTGRWYRIDLEALDVGSLREIQRLLRDLEGDRRAAVSRARVEPWRG